MSRRSKKNRLKSRRQAQVAGGNGRNVSTPAGPSSQAIVKNGSEADQVKQLAEAAAADATEEDIDTAAGNPVPVGNPSLDVLINEAAEARGLFEAQRERANREEKVATEERDQLREKREALEERESRVKIQQEDQVRKKQQLDERDSEFAERQEDILERESDADAGFARRHRDLIDRLGARANEVEDWESGAIERRKSLHAELRVEREAHQKRLEAELAQIEASREELDARASRLQKGERTLAVDHEILDEDRASSEARVDRKAAKQIEQRENTIIALEEQLEAARNARKEYARQLAEREEDDLRFGNKNPQEVLEELRQLREENGRLRETIGGMPSEESGQRLAELESQHGNWLQDRMELDGEVAQLKQDRNNKRIAVVELESLRNHKAALEASNDLLAKALEEEIRKVKEMVRGQDGASPFPTCSSADSDRKLQTPRATTDKLPDLQKFADYVRDQMAFDPKTKKALYYSPEDVRSFLGGLAMSRLHLLQGISGTGKTSLPLAFARAIGAGHKLIEVQAGWRDRQDLVGHFNAFERRFYESEFLVALYRAGCPLYRDTPFIVILDEMNLSHPEQYFADLLSALEQDVDRQRLVLMTAAVEPAPQLFQDGRVLPIPPNVWFIGTANHDETTKDFADKTYDRSHVMELPRHPDKFEAKQNQPNPPIEFAALTTAFRQAKTNHSQEAEKAYSFLENRLADPLGQRFRVGWGNRLERQMQDYVPVVIAAGGCIGEAVDHILATKLLRKIRDRHDNRPEDITALRELITSEWTHLDPDYDPKKSHAILREELHRMGYDDEIEGI